MNTEMKKKKPNLSIVENRMSRTFQTRRKEVVSLSSLQLIAKYPALNLSDCVSMGFCDICITIKKNVVLDQCYTPLSNDVEYLFFTY